MTNTYIFESDLTGMYEVTLNTNNVLSGPFNLNFTYGNLYTFLHNYNIDVVDENDKIKIINNSENNYYISLKQLDKIIEITLGPKSISETPIRLSASRLFGPEMPCKDSLRDFITLELGYVETDFEYLLLTNLFYLKNLDVTPKQITITNLGETGEFFEPMYPNNPTLQITPSTMSVCLSPNICDDTGGSACDGATPTIKLGALDNFTTTKGYSKDAIIDVPAIHLPLETNSNNVGYTQNLSISNTGNPSYATIENKKCIKFESGKYITINSHNIFNLGTTSDFYIELNVYPLVVSNSPVLFDSYISGSSDTWQIWYDNCLKIYSYGSNHVIASSLVLQLNVWQTIKIARLGNVFTLSIDQKSENIVSNISLSNSQTVALGAQHYSRNSSYDFNGYMSDFKMFLGTSKKPENFEPYTVLNLDFSPTNKSYLFKDKFNKCVIHPVNITQRDYQDSQYCLSLNGTNQYLSLGKNPSLNFGKDDFVLNFKIKPKFSANSTHTFSRIFAPFLNSPSDLKEYIMLPGENYSQTSYRGAVMVVLDEATQVFMGTPRLNASEINNVTLVRSGNVFSLYLNDILSVEKTFTGDFNLNRYDETIIGASKSSSGVVSYLNATLYSIKILRNTSDVSLLENSVPIPEVAPVAEIDLKVNNNTLVDTGSSQISWLLNSAVLNSDYFTGNYKASPIGNLLQSFYKNPFVLDIVCSVTSLSNVLSQWDDNLRYNIQLSPTELIFTYYYTYSGGYTTDTITCPVTISNFTRVTLLVNSSRAIKIYVNGNEMPVGNILLKDSFFNDVNHNVTLGDSNLKIKRFRLYNSQSNYISPI